MTALAIPPVAFFVVCLAYGLAHDIARIAQRYRQHGEGKRVRGENNLHGSVE